MTHVAPPKEKALHIFTYHMEIKLEYEKGLNDLIRIEQGYD